MGSLSVLMQGRSDQKHLALPIYLSDIRKHAQKIEKNHDINV